MRKVSRYPILICCFFLVACTTLGNAPTSTPAPSPTAAPTETAIPSQTATLAATTTVTPEATETPTTTLITTVAASPTAELSGTPDRPPRTDRYIDCTRSSTGLIPLTDMGASQDYLGEEGGLYGNGQNQPPEAHWQIAQQESALIGPRNAAGNPAPDGKIGFVAIGMSNVRIEFDRFERLARDVKSPAVVLVNGAQPAKVADTWADPDPNDDPWVVLAEIVRRADLTPAQVQVAWLKETEAGPRPGRDDFPVFAEELRDDTAAMVMKVKELYPNVRLIYLSSRIYGGYSLILLSPEPFAYEGAFSVRWLIEDQIHGGGESGVTYDNAPVLLWGPYLWADGMTPRSDGLTWECDDFQDDGVHPDGAGRQKVAEMLLNFLTSDPLAKVWFLGSINLQPVTPTP